MGSNLYNNILLRENQLFGLLCPSILTVSLPRVHRSASLLGQLLFVKNQPSTNLATIAKEEEKKECNYACKIND